MNIEDEYQKILSQLTDFSKLLLPGVDYSYVTNPPSVVPSNNVLIPQTGAAKYWYVDPRAGNYQGIPITHSDLEQQSLYRANPNMYSPTHEDQDAASINAIQRLTQQ